MSEKTDEKKEKKQCKHSYSQHGGTGLVYCMGLIGAAIYFISTASGFWVGVWGLVKAIFWPAFLAYGLLKYLGM